MIRAAAALLVLAAASALAPAEGGEGAAPDRAWQPFAGTWSAVGVRYSLPTETERPAVIVRVTGAVVITRGPGLGTGFQGEAFYFDDGSGSGTGRAVWTDGHGDRIYSELRGEPTETGKRVTGAITGGTGRFAGLEGDYSLTWQYVVAAEDGVIQGRTADLQGRVRPAGAPR